MAIHVLPNVPCANPGQHNEPPPNAVAFVYDQKFGTWWTPRCRVCLNRLDGHNQPTRYEVVYLKFPSDIVVPATADHDSA